LGLLVAVTLDGCATGGNETFLLSRRVSISANRSLGSRAMIDPTDRPVASEAHCGTDLSMPAMTMD